MLRKISSWIWLYKWLIVFAVAIVALIVNAPAGRRVVINNRVYYVPPEYPGSQYGIPNNTTFATAVIWPSMEPYTRERAVGINLGACGVVEIMVSAKDSAEVAVFDYEPMIRESARRLKSTLEMVGVQQGFEVWDLIRRRDVGDKRYFLTRKLGRVVEKIECDYPGVTHFSSCIASFFHKDMVVHLNFSDQCVDSFREIERKAEDLIDSFEVRERGSGK